MTAAADNNLLQKDCRRPKRPAVAKQPLVFIALQTHPQQSHAGMISSYVLLRQLLQIIGQQLQQALITCLRAR
jgi:hypothetical protein